MLVLESDFFLDWGNLDIFERGICFSLSFFLFTKQSVLKKYLGQGASENQKKFFLNSHLLASSMALESSA